MGKEKGKGKRKHLAGRRENLFAGAGEEDRAGLAARWLGQGGAAARPLDGGVLTRRGARAPARGPATAPWLAAHSRSVSSQWLRLR